MSQAIGSRPPCRPRTCSWDPVQAAMARARVAGVEAGGGAGARAGSAAEGHDRPIDIVARELEQHAALRAEARREIDALLA